MTDINDTPFYPKWFTMNRRQLLQLIIRHLNYDYMAHKEKGTAMPIQLREYMQEELMAGIDDTMMQEFLDDCYEHLFEATLSCQPNMRIVHEAQEQRLLKLMQDLLAKLQQD